MDDIYTSDQRLLFYLVWWLVWTFAGVAVGGKRQRGGLGLLLGALLGPIGVLIVANLKEPGPVCPYCGGKTVKGAIKCRHCASDLVPPILKA